MNQIKESTAGQKRSGWLYNFNQLQDIKEAMDKRGVSLSLETIETMIYSLEKLGFLQINRG
jgi:hypothetical protein